jgi:hypothetical protein
VRTATENSRDLQTADTQARASDTKASGRRPQRRRFGLRNWRVAVRLVALIAIPTMVTFALAGLRVSSDLGSASGFERIERLTEFAKRVNLLVHYLEAERDVVAGSVTGRPPAVDPQGKQIPDREVVRKTQATVDTVAVQVRGQAQDIDAGFSNVVRDRVRLIVSRLGTLPALRGTATGGQLLALSSVERYSLFIADLLQINQLIAQGTTDTSVAATTRALESLAQAKNEASKQRAILYSVILNGQFAPNELEAMRASRSNQEAAIVAFRASANAGQRQVFEDTVTGAKVDSGEFVRLQALSLAEVSPQLATRPLNQKSATQWYADMTSTIGAMRSVETTLIDQALDRSILLRQNAQRDALLDAGILLIVLILVLGSTIVVARSLVRPLRRLRIGALEIAGTRLPGLVRRLREPDAAETRLEVEPIDVDTTDEIGEVARAFDEVHREAVRLAANEALLRGNINAMFVNLSRRSQSLIERQLGLIDQLEQGEEDSERLSSLFKLDHLATRMRRNSENLLVLGGHEQARRWSGPVPLVDIVRASLSEIEQYDRVTLRVQADVAIAGQAVSDIVHLAAELIENATIYSPQHTKVTVSGHLLSGGGAMLQITDNGVGMSVEELEDCNWRLANPPVIDVSVSRRMGLFVVGRLATRHGVRVELRSALSGGLTAFVMLPAALVLSEGGAAAGAQPQPYEGFEGPQPEPVLAAPPSAPALGQPPTRNGSQSGGTFHTAPQQAVPMQEAYPSVGAPPSGEAPPLPRRDTPGAPGAPMPPPRRADGVPAEPAGPPLPRREPTGVGPGSESSFDQPSQPSMPSQSIPSQSMPSQPSLPREYTAGIGRENMAPPTGPQPQAPMEAGTGPLPRFQTGPLPQVGGAHAPFQTGLQSVDRGPARRERLPIFDAVESEWFQRRKSTPVSRTRGGSAPVTGGPSLPVPQQAAPAPAPPPPAPPPVAAPDISAPAPPAPPPVPSPAISSWRSTGDEGWRAAEAAARPTTAEPTTAGLPRRVPGANLVPGTAGQSRGPQSPAPTMSPDAVRSRLSGFQQGVRQGREAARTETSSDELGKA